MYKLRSSVLNYHGYVIIFIVLSISFKTQFYLQELILDHYKPQNDVSLGLYLVINNILVGVLLESEGPINPIYNMDFSTSKDDMYDQDKLKKKVLTFGVTTNKFSFEIFPLNENYLANMMEKYDLQQTRDPGTVYDLNKPKRFDVDVLEDHLTSSMPKYVTDIIYRNRWIVFSILVFRSLLKGYSNLEGATYDNMCQISELILTFNCAFYYMNTYIGLVCIVSSLDIKRLVRALEKLEYMIDPREINESKIKLDMFCK
mmetsp:Transcript_12259/g.10565  ORF Transcript_12259/g.10565 Transcript_12259/m.10565 type:complete len:258 (-) Transcript_12259:90-863(-)